jgi:UDP-N-acetylmuramoyl-L-alanyl-D-glutamate--2,6-diaminopimelate ligase
MTTVNFSNISILIDYAHEPESMKLLLETMKKWQSDKYFDYIIHIVSCDGAGRDEWKKPILGKISHENADFTIVTLDNYDERDDKNKILNLIMRDFDTKLLNKQFTSDSNRSVAFDIALKKAVEILSENELKILICSTGVGCENGLIQPGGKIEWDEKKIWQQKFANLKKQ